MIGRKDWGGGYNKLPFINSLRPKFVPDSNCCCAMIEMSRNPGLVKRDNGIDAPVTHVLFDNFSYQRGFPPYTWVILQIPVLRFIYTRMILMIEDRTPIRPVYSKGSTRVEHLAFSSFPQTTIVPYQLVPCNWIWFIPADRTRTLPCALPLRRVRRIHGAKKSARFKSASLILGTIHSSSGWATTKRISLASRNGRGKSAVLAESAHAARYAARGRMNSNKRKTPASRTITNPGLDIRVNYFPKDAQANRRFHTEPNGSLSLKPFRVACAIQFKKSHNLNRAISSWRRNFNISRSRTGLTGVRASRVPPIA